jgi:hypothetical protein
MRSTTIATAVGLSLALAVSGAAFAADSGSSGSSGSTSGPAAGGNVQPGSENSGVANGHNKGTTASGGGAGVSGAKGSKNGPSDQAPSK